MGRDRQTDTGYIIHVPTGLSPLASHPWLWGCNWVKYDHRIRWIICLKDLSVIQLMHSNPFTKSVSLGSSQSFTTFNIKIRLLMADAFRDTRPKHLLRPKIRFPCFYVCTVGIPFVYPFDSWWYTQPASVSLLIRQSTCGTKEGKKDARRVLYAHMIHVLEKKRLRMLCCESVSVWRWFMHDCQSTICRYLYSDPLVHHSLRSQGV